MAIHVVYWNYPKLIDQYLNKVYLGGLDWLNPWMINIVLKIIANNYAQLISQYLNMVCPGWLGLANPMDDNYCFKDYSKQLCSIDNPVP